MKQPIHKLITARDIGRADYEDDVTLTPRYHDGSPRKTWEELSEIARWSWSRPRTIARVSGRSFKLEVRSA